MKRCPNCNQLFTEENMFCLNDGTSLLYIPETGQNPTIIPTSGEMPTQYIQRPKIAEPKAAENSSRWLYLIIGILATALVGMATFMFTKSGEKKENSNQNDTKIVEDSIKPNQTDNKPRKNEQSFTNPTPINTPVQTNINPNLSPAGNWSGNWNSNTTDFTASVNLQSAGDDKISGQILWTLRSTTNPKKIGKEGLSATEYVQGNFDRTTRTLSLNGYQTNDPNGLIIKDKYKLVLAENNQQLNGFSFGGKTRGKFNLRR